MRYEDKIRDLQAKVSSVNTVDTAPKVKELTAKLEESEKVRLILEKAKESEQKKLKSHKQTTNKQMAEL